MFAPLLMKEASGQIGLNELHRHFGLKAQSIVGLSENEELEKNLNTAASIRKNSSYFQDKVNWFNNKLPTLDRFRHDEINHAIKMLDREIPEIRKLFVLKFANKSTDLSQFNVDKLFNVFFQTRSELMKCIYAIVSQSTDAFIFKTKTKCSLRN